ncbi:MAG TPA: class I SAM-dependent methyltransferase [Casimicrobiaceae bacterium]|nr:class I SAM-dependent methyltransferase [Casimicrobiaceae bacterium]
MSAELRQSYDEFPYISFPFPQSHPDRLATIGWLFGMEPARVEACRVLELGCASGGNLLPMAASLPGSRFVGVDFSPVQIARGAADVEALGLANVELLAMDMMDFSEVHGEFDYIIAHGVFSWVPNAVQEQLLAICARQLRPAGIAYVSYNTLPGWRMRSVVRDAMTFHTRGLADPARRVEQARAVLEFLAEAVGDDASAYGVALRAEAEHLRKQADYYILHDHLEEVNEPLYFHQFIERAARHGLGYLGEANFAAMLGSGFSQQVNETLARVAPDVLKREQFIDFLRARTFRETLLVHRDVQLTRKISPDRVMALRVASRAKPVRAQPDLQSNAIEEFRAPEGSVQTPNRLTKAALSILAELWPVSMAFEQLDAAARLRAGLPGGAIPEQRGRLASEMLQCYAAGVLELHYATPPFAVQLGERPEGSRLARLQASRGGPATTLRHEHGAINGETLRLFLLLDGTRTRSQIAASMWPGVPESRTLPELEVALDHLARLGLMLG